MNHAGSKSSCTLWCMIIGGAIGLIAFLLLWLVIDWRVLSALMLGAIIAAIGAVVFPILFCGNTTGPVEAGSAGIGAGTAPTASDDVSAGAAPTASASANSSAGTTAVASAAAVSATAAAASASVTPSKFLAGEAELADKKGEWKYEAEPKPAAKKSTAKPAKKASTAKSSATKSAAKSKSKASPVAKDGKPPLLKKARASGADDLKQIKGVGPGLENTLNELGFYHFDQIAAWRKKEVEWVDSRLKFKGRIVRDDWIKQCKTLAKGGATEFSNRVKKGDVY